MKNSDEIIERAALEKVRLRSDKEDNFLQESAVHEIRERLEFIKKDFAKILVVCGKDRKSVV